MKKSFFSALALLLLLACNRPTEDVETDTTGTTPASEKSIEEMASEREEQTKAALERQRDSLRRGDTTTVR